MIFSILDWFLDALRAFAWSLDIEHSFNNSIARTMLKMTNKGYINLSLEQIYSTIFPLT